MCDTIAAPMQGAEHPADENTTPPLTLPDERIDVQAPEEALPAVNLQDLPDSLQQACTRAGWSQLTPVQSLALPYLLARRDLMVQSRTGSGKTGTYLLPLLRHLSMDRAAVQALVLVPTRELAVQVEKEAQPLFEGTGLTTVAVYGGVGYGKQIDALRRGAQLVVGTPGRVLDHLLKRTFTLDALRVLIFDEADRMLSIGFYPDMKEVQRYLPKKRVDTCLFSATYPPHVLKLAGEFMDDPSMLSLSHTQVHVAEVQHIYCSCKPMDKDRALIRLIETENPTSAIIFCNTKANVHYVTEVLRGFGYNAAELSADLSQSKREVVLDAARSGELRFLVATDVAARGIDIPDLSHVFLYEPPEDHESYIHRAGRTGRAGAAGTVISLVDIMQKMELERIARHYKIQLIARETPTDADVARVVADRLTTQLEARYRTLTGLQRERVQRFTELARTLSQSTGEDEHAPLLAMLLDQCYQDSLSSPVIAPQGTPKSRPQRGDRSRGGKRRERGERSRSGEPRTQAEAPAQADAPAGDAQAASDNAPRRNRRRRSSRRSGAARENTSD